MGEIIDFKSDITHDSQPITNDEACLFSVYDVAVSLIIDIEEGKTFSMEAIKEQMIEVIQITQEEL